MDKISFNLLLLISIVLILAFNACNNTEPVLLDRTIKYARKWNLPDSLFLKDIFYMGDYEFYENYCSWLKKFDENCFEDKAGFRLIYTPGGLGITAYSEIYSLYEKKGKLHLVKKTLDFKEDVPADSVWNGQLEIDTVCISNSVHFNVWDSIAIILDANNYNDLPPLDIIPGIKPIGHGAFFKMEFNNGSSYHRIYRKSTASKKKETLFLMHDKIKLMLDKYCANEILEYNRE